MGQWLLWLGAGAEAGYTHAPGNFGRANESVLGLDHGLVMVVQLCKLTKKSLNCEITMSELYGIDTIPKKKKVKVTCTQKKRKRGRR